MAIVIRMVSADGKKVIMKSLPGLPSHLKVPIGAKVDIVENGQTMTLSQYVNEHANRTDHDKVLDDAKVTVETVDNWDAASTWLDSLAGKPNNEEWFSDAKDHPEGTTLGMSTNALLVGGAVVGAVGFGVIKLTEGHKDITPPLAPAALDLADADDVGSSNSDNITNKTTDLTISGTSEAGSTVELFNGTVSLGTVVADSNGTFTKDVSLTAGAAHDIVARATDSHGNASSLSTVLRIGIDATAPAAPAALDLADADDTGSSATDNITSRTTDLTISGTAEASSTVELFSGTTSLGTVVASATGTFTKDVTLAAGVNEITARTTDVAGNPSAAASAILKITVDATGPAAPTVLDLAAADDTGSSNTDNLTSKTSGLTITGNAEVGSVVELFDGTTSLGTATTTAAGTFTRDISLEAGVHAITAKATDAAGNTGTASTALQLTIDTTAPAAPLSLSLNPDDDSGISNTDHITNKTSGLGISGTADANSQIQLFAGAANLGTVTADATGHFSLDVVSLAEGTYAITAKAVDSDGSLGPASDTLNIVIDTTAPAAPTALDLATADDNGVSNTDNITSQTSGLTITGNGEVGSRLELFDGTKSLGTVLVDASGHFSEDIALAVGQHAITAKATDAAGNVGAASAALNISVTADAASALALHALTADIDHVSLANGSGSFG